MALRFQEHREHFDAILAAVRRASDPRACTAAAVRRRPPQASRPAVIAVGKAAPAMLEGFCEVCTSRELVVVVPPGVQGPAGAIVADHPVPSERCVRASERVARFVEVVASGVIECDGFVVLLSGGASSLLAWPAPGIDIRDYAAATEAMLGLDIRRLNAIRKHCERLKGGRLAALMAPLPCDTYVLSDVIGDDLSTIGSGPTAPDPTTFADACEPFNRELEFTEAERVLFPYLREGARGKHAETPKPGDPVFDRVRAELVGGNAMALEAARAKATELGFAVTLYRGVEGDAKRAGAELAREAMDMAGPAAVVYGGETTVNVGGKRGKGGRNQELALGAALAIDGKPNIAIATFATDGVDGPTDAAGAMVTGETCRVAGGIGLDPGEALADHDSYTFFDALGRAGHPHLIRTGPTGTNVNDVAIALAY